MELRPRARASAAQRELAPQMGRRSLQAGRSEFLILALSPFLLPTSKVTDDHLFIGNNLGPDVPIAPPTTGPPEGWAAVGLVSSAFFIRGLWASLLRVSGSLPLILGSERVRNWVVDRF